MHMRNSHLVAEKLYVLNAALDFQSLHCSAEIFPSAVFDLLTFLQSISFWSVENQKLSHVKYLTL